MMTSSVGVRFGHLIVNRDALEHMPDYKEAVNGALDLLKQPVNMNKAGWHLRDSVVGSLDAMGLHLQIVPNHQADELQVHLLSKATGLPAPGSEDRGEDHKQAVKFDQGKIQHVLGAYEEPTPVHVYQALTDVIHKALQGMERRLRDLSSHVVSCGSFTQRDIQFVPQMADHLPAVEERQSAKPLSIEA